MTGRTTHDGGTVSLTAIRAWLDALSSPKARAAILGVLGLSEDALSRWDAFVDASLETKLVAWAVKHHGNGAGLEAAARLPRGAFAVLEYLARTAPDFHHAVDYLLRCNRLLGAPALTMRYEKGQVHVRDAHEYEGNSAIEIALTEFRIGSFCHIAHDALGDHWRPVIARFVHQATAPPETYAAVLGCPAEHGATTTEIAFPVATLRAPMREADARLHALLVDLGETALAMLDDQSPVSHSVRRVLVDELRTGRISVADIASQLGFTARTLQNRLAREGTSLTDLTEDVRRTLAERYLARPTATVPEVALLLGYSEPSAFRRAFKRWTGTTPRRFRLSRD